MAAASPDTHRPALPPWRPSIAAQIVWRPWRTADATPAYRRGTVERGALSATVSAMGALLAAIASVSPIVGGIGIRLVSVTERAREIGIHLAAGATS